MSKFLLKKMLVFGTILLFLGVCSVSAVNTNVNPIEIDVIVKNPDNNIESFYPTDDAGLSQDAPNTNKGG